MIGRRFLWCDQIEQSSETKMARVGRAMFQPAFRRYRVPLVPLSEIREP